MLMLILVIVRSQTNIEHKPTTFPPATPIPGLPQLVDTIEQMEWPHRLGVAPDTVACRELVETQLNRTYAKHMAQSGRPFDSRYLDSLMWFDDIPAMEEYLAYREYGYPGQPQLYMGVMFEEVGSASNPSWSYSLRLNQTDTPYTGNHYDRFSRVYTEKHFEKYLSNGFLTMQHALDHAIVHSTARNTNYTAPAWNGTQYRLEYEPMVSQLPVGPHSADVFLDLVQHILPLFLMVSFCFPVSCLVKLIVREKESRVKECLKIMGLTDVALWSSWCTTYLIIFGFSAIVLTITVLPSIFTHSNGLVLLLFFLCYAISLVSFSTMLSTMFNNSKVCGSLSIVIFFAFSLIYVAVNSAGQSAKNAMCLSAPACFAFGIQNVAYWESVGVGAHWSNLTDAPDNFALGTALLMMLLDAGLYLLLTLYFDRVLPKQYGQRLPFYFPFTAQFWRSCLPGDEERVRREAKNNLGSPLLETPLAMDVLESDNDDLTSSNYESVPAESQGRLGVGVRNLRKVFNEGTEQETVAVKGLNLDIFKGQILCLLGHNGAGKSTTIGMLTGLTPPTSGDARVEGLSVSQDMAIIRESMGVCPQHDVLYDELTVKEHLLFFGELKGVSRDTIEQEVEDMVAKVGLTEKVDAPSDSLSGGMKRKLSVAMALIGDCHVVFLDEPTSGMDPYSRRSTWNLIRSCKKDRCIVLTTHFMDEADLLGDRIAIMAHGELQCVGSSLFLKKRYGVGYSFVLSKSDEHPCDFDTLDAAIRDYVPDADLLSNVGSEVSYRLPFESSPSFPPLFRMLDERQDRLGIRTYGISVTTLEEVFLKVGEEADGVGAGGVDSVETAQVMQRMETEMQQAEEEERNDITGGGKIFWRHFRALFAKRWHSAKRSKKAQGSNMFLSMLFLALGFLLAKDGFFSGHFPVLVLDTANYDPYNAVAYNIYTPPPAQPDVEYSEFFQTEAFRAGLFQGNDYGEPLQSSTNLTAFQDTLMRTRFDCTNGSRWGAYDFFPMATEASTGVSRASAVVMGNSSAYHSVPIFLSMLSQSVLREVSGNPEASIHSSSQPFSYTEQEMLQLDGYTKLFAAIMLSMAFAFVPASFVVFIVKERNSKAKHQQLVSGVSLWAYWASTFAWDMCNFLVPVAGAIVVMYMFKSMADAFVGENLPCMIVVLLSYGMASISFTYMMSFAFKDHTTAQNLLLVMYILTGTWLLIAWYFMDVIESTRNINEKLVYIYRLLPSFALGNSAWNMGFRTIDNPDSTSAFEWDVAGVNITYMLVETIVYFLATMGMEYMQSNPQSLSCLKDPVVHDEAKEEDEDVFDERQRLMSGDAEDVIQVKGLRKVYKKNKKVAVKDMWFGVKEGEVLGYLGINGAGKTSTMAMLSGEFPPTQGTAALQGIDISNQIKCRRLIGYCPQFDAILPLLTAREHLYLFARIKGVREEYIEELADRMIHALSLQEYAARPAGQYSGGNKRKLSVAIALIGSPPIVFLDEPSTGMDPRSRRFMWDFISSTMKGRSVILTTHSMEECQALCHRIAIMVSGALSCIGTAQHLKSRFGTGYQVDMRVPSTGVPALLSFLRSTFPGVEVIENHDGAMKMKLDSGSMRLSQVFESIEANKSALEIESYSVSQTSLEQIFVNFAKQQSEETGKVDGMLSVQEAY